MPNPVQDSLTTAALAGLLLGASACGGGPPTHDPAAMSADHAAGMEQPGTRTDHACRGLNECKGQGGCAVAGQNDCAGKNPCKGKGGCKHVK